MTTSVKSIPEGYEGVLPHLCVRDTPAAIEFYSDVFGATESLRLADPSGIVGYAEDVSEEDMNRRYASLFDRA
jgi:PhnB protein